MKPLKRNRLDGPPVYPADPVSRRFQGGRVLQGLVWVSYYWLTFASGQMD